eukprot:s6452_g6.t1
MQTQKCGLEDSTIPEVPAEASRLYAEGTYHALITRLRKMKTDEAKEQEKRAEKERKTKDEMCKREPAILLKDLVGELVQQNMAETRLMETETTQDRKQRRWMSLCRRCRSKHGGYAIFERHNLRMVHDKILSSSAYVVCSGVDWTALKHNHCAKLLIGNAVSAASWNANF